MTNLTPVTRQRMQLDCAAREAEGYLELGMHGAALRSLQRRGQLVHSDPRACFLMGESLRELSRYREALYPLRRAAELEPDNVEAWLALGWCCKRADRLDEAVLSLEVALQKSPEDALLQYNLACYYSLAGRGLDALRRLKRAFTLEPDLRTLVEDEPDFDCLRRDPGSRMLLAGLIGSEQA